MAPAVEYEIQACLDNYTKHERKQRDYCATEYQSLVNEDGTKSELHCHISFVTLYKHSCLTPYVKDNKNKKETRNILSR